MLRNPCKLFVTTRNISGNVREMLSFRSSTVSSIQFPPRFDWHRVGRAAKAEKND